MPTVNWTVNGTTLADQCGWSGDGAAHPFNETDFYVDETYNTDSKASAARLTGAGFSGTIDSAILTIPRFSDNQGTNGTLRIRLIAENNPGSLAATGGTPPSARTYRTAYVDYTFPSDAVTVNIDVTSLIQDLLTAGFTYTGTQLIGVVVAGSSVGGTGWGSNATVSWRALWRTTTPLTLAITYTAGGGTSAGTGTAAGSSSVAGFGLSVARATSATSSASTVTSPGLSSSRGTGSASVASAVIGASPATSGAAPSLVQSVAFSYLYNSVESATGTITSANVTTTAGNDIFIWCGTWEYHNDNQAAQQARDQTPPTDNKGGTYDLIGTVSTPNRWPTAGEAWYRNTTGTRGSGHNFTKIYGYNSEITCFALEIANAGAVSNFLIQQFAAGGSSNQTYTVNVTSNGPALLVVTLFVDQYERTAGATPSGWTLVGRKGVLSPVRDDADIACVIFAKQVTSGGSYTCPIAINGSEAQGAASQSFAIEAQGVTAGGSFVTSSSSVVGIASSKCAASGATSSASSAVAVSAARCLAASSVSCTSSAVGLGSSASVGFGSLSIASNATGSASSRSLATGTASSTSSVVGSGESGAFALGYGPSVSASTAVGSGSSRAAIAGTATSSSTVTAPGASSVGGTSSVSSPSSTVGAGSSRVLATGSTSSSSAVVGAGSGVASGTGIGTASSVSTVTGSGASRAVISAPLTVASTVTGSGASRSLGTGTATSSSTAIGSGESAAVVVGTGVSSGSSTVTGQAKAIIYAFGGSAGQVLAIAAGFSLVLATAEGYGASNCAAVGASTCTAIGASNSASTVIGSAGSRAQVGVIAMQISNACTMTMEFFP